MPHGVRTQWTRSMPLRRPSTIILALSPFLVLGLITAVLAWRATLPERQHRAAVESVSSFSAFSPTGAAAAAHRPG